MKLFGATHDGYWLGGYAVALANDEEEAKELFLKLFEPHEFNIISIVEFAAEGPSAWMVSTGDY